MFAKRQTIIFAKWLDTKCGDNKIGRVKAIRGKHHDHLGMKLDFSAKGKLEVDMRCCIKDMVEDFPHNFKSTDTMLTPANKNLFGGDNSKSLDKTQAEQCHTFVAKGLLHPKGKTQHATCNGRVTHPSSRAQ